MLPLLLILGFLMLGHAVLGALFWALLNVPESSLAMIALSAVIALLLLLGTAWVEMAALLEWIDGDGATVRRSLLERAARAVRAVPAFLVALAVFLVVLWATWLAGRSIEVHRGELDAWLMVHLQIVQPGAVHAALGWLLWALCFGPGLSIALTLLTALAINGFHSMERVSWLGKAFQPRRLAFVPLAVFVFLWFPWHVAYWRPAVIPPTWLEPAFAAVKLSLLYMVANLGWALVLREVAGATPDVDRRVGTTR
jgi:hypothetical protein